jgi:hypothetical protein
MTGFQINDKPLGLTLDTSAPPLTLTLTNTTSCTPRTDALDRKAHDSPDEVTEADYRALCRELEVSLSEVQHECEQLRQIRKDFAERNAVLFERDQRSFKALEEIRDLIDGRADVVDGPDGIADQPNLEMRIDMVIDAAIGAAK